MGKSVLFLDGKPGVWGASPKNGNIEMDGCFLSTKPSEMDGFLR